MNDPVAVRRFAAALFEAAKSANDVDKVGRDLKSLTDKGNAENIVRALENPRHKTQLKESIVSKIGQSASSKLTANFLTVLIKKSRVGLLEDIADQYEELVKESQGVVPCEVILAKEPDKSFKERIVNALKRITHTEVEMTVRVKPETIGGIAIRIRNRILDATFRTKIQQMKRELLEVKLSQ